MPNGTMTTTIQLALGGAVHSKSFTAPTGGRCMVRVACWVRARLAAGFGLGGLRGSGSGSGRWQGEGSGSSHGSS